jgi:steroid 5-alpha reductase family enzyme
MSRRLEPFYSKDDEPWFTGPAKYPLKLAGFWSAQALWSFSVLLPVTVAQAAAPRGSMGAWGWTGFGLFLFFCAYEATGAALQ